MTWLGWAYALHVEIFWCVVFSLMAAVLIV